MATMADGIAVGLPGQIPFTEVCAHVDEFRTVSEESLSRALLALAERAKMVVEPAGAAAVAALLDAPNDFEGPVVAVLSGGNIDPLLLAAIIERGMVRAGRLARVRVSARDVPGSLAQITATVAEAGANVDEVHHQRAFTMLAAQNVDIELVLQTRGRAHLASVLVALKDAGFEAEEQH
jgi:threonine dehydratase